MLVPVTAVGKYSYFIFRQYDIWLDSSNLTIKPESIAQPMQGFTGENFWFGVATAYPGHHPASHLFIDDINHWLTGADSSDVYWLFPLR